MIKTCSRVTKGERVTDGQSCYTILGTKYLQNDTLLFQICSVRLK